MMIIIMMMTMPFASGRLCGWHGHDPIPPQSRWHGHFCKWKTVGAPGATELTAVWLRWPCRQRRVAASLAVGRGIAGHIGGQPPWAAASLTSCLAHEGGLLEGSWRMLATS